MSDDSRKTAKEAAGTAADAARKTNDEAQKKLKEARNQVALGQLFKEFLDKLKEGKGREAFTSLKAIVIAVFSKKLADLRANVEQTRDAASDRNKPMDQPTESKDDGKKEDKKEDGRQEDAKEEDTAEEEEETEMERLGKIPDPNKRTVRIAEQMVKEKITGQHCWDWCEKVYKNANVKRQTIFSSFNTYEGKDCGDHCAKDEELNKIKPGAHIFINNKNKYDVHGNHSVIFLGWVDREKRIAKTAGCPFTGRPGVIHSREDLFKKPVTSIANPVDLS